MGCRFSDAQYLPRLCHGAMRVLRGFMKFGTQVGRPMVALPERVRTVADL